MNIFLINNNITNMKILDKIDFTDFSEYKLTNIDYSKWYNGSINNLIEDNLNQDIIYLGNIVSLDIYSSFGLIHKDFTNLYHTLISNIYFKDIFYDLKEKIKNNLNLTNYSTIHLRIEDDCINSFSKYYKLSVNEFNEKIKHYYNEKIQNINNPIYICSGILNFHNKINKDYYIELKKIIVF